MADHFGPRAIAMFYGNDENRWRNAIELFHTKRDLDSKPDPLSTLLKVQK